MSPDDGRPSKPWSGASAASGSEWPTRTADLVEHAVGILHDRVIRPITLAARAIVFGTIAVVMAGVLIILLAVGLVRVLDDYAFGGRVWASDALIGAILVGAGSVAWTLRRSRTQKEHTS
jgi:hypothetical protein